MLSRRGLIGAGLVGALASAGTATAQESWARYRNARFGTSIDYMEFFEPGEEPANGDGLVFTSPEAEFRVFARHNLDGDTAKAMLARLAGDPDYAGLSYRSIAGRRLTVSGRRGDRIFYEVHLFSPTGLIHSFMIDYPAAHKASYDAMIARMARSFGGP
jgi:serine/threonine-protein kinase